MSGLKQSLRLEPIANTTARAILDAHHPLGAGSPWLLSLGVFWDEKCEGVLTWGAPVINNAVTRYGIRLREAFELRKMWLSDVPPKNAESRALAVACRLVARQYPQFQLFLTYCDPEESAVAYRATGWVPQTVYRSLREVVLPSGDVLSIRDFNRRGGQKVFGKAWKGRYIAKRKWIYSLNATIAGLV